MPESLHRTPLFDLHVQFGGRMVPFAGWEMPVCFAGINDEHHHTRTACSVFDVSHMGRLKLTGDGCESFLNLVCTRDLKGAEAGRSYYSNICREDGGILDDVIVSRFADRWGVVCNASNREKILNWLRRHAEGKDVKIVDETFSTAMVACQGPRTIELAREVADTDLSSLGRYKFLVRELGPLQIITYRSGYTGEDGVEVVLPAVLANGLVGRLLGAPEQPHPTIKPAGLGSRDTLRLEAAMPLYGHELTEDVDSLTAGLDWCVDLNKDFIGAEPMRKLKAQGLRRVRVGLELDGRRIARQHAAVFAEDQPVGEVTSGTLSPTLGKSIAMAYVAAEQSVAGTELSVEVSGKRVASVVVKLPFYKRAKS